MKYALIGAVILAIWDVTSEIVEQWREERRLKIKEQMKKED